MASIYRPPWRVDVTVRASIRPPISMAAMARTVAAALEATRAPRPASIGLILTDDAELTELNRVHMHEDGPTDVLSFPLLASGAFPGHEGQAAPNGPPQPEAPSFPLPPGRRLHLGDIVVSVERAIDQAEAGRGGHTGVVRWSPSDELRLLVTHGALHICGWDHAEAAEEAAMRALEARLLAT